MRKGHTSTILMKQWLNTIEYLQNKQSLYHLSFNYQVFIFHQRPQKMVNYYLLQCVQALQHMRYTSTLDKWQMKRNYSEDTINLTAFGW